MLGIVALRTMILTQRVWYLCISSALLLFKFNSARRISVKVALQSGTGVLFSYLMRSTEVRLTLLAVVGVTKAVTYSVQATAQSASSVADQLGRFAYTLECKFPVILLVVYDAHKSSYHRENRSAPTTGHFTQTTIDEFKLYPLVTIERRIEVSGNPRQKSSPEENMISQASPSCHHHHHHEASSGDMLDLDGQTRTGDAKSNLQSGGIVRRWSSM
ncbi:uncharacterized protein PG986_001494 [Apiospora aurea]|uniref:Uncharacterized protein n=1 Tax=Apiospora aurea TaxID=335848 RepID=A0ABR1QXN2_9PEZI